VLYFLRVKGFFFDESYDCNLYVIEIVEMFACRLLKIVHLCVNC
jgi:hypothetical protein